MRPAPRVFRMLRQGITVPRPAPATAGPAAGAPALCLSPVLSAEESCRRTATAVALRALSTSPTAAPVNDADDEAAAPADAAAADADDRALPELTPVEGPNVLRVSRTTTPRMLATKVGAMLVERPGDDVVVSAVGAQSLFSACRALAMTNEDRASAGLAPAVVRSFVDLGARNAKALVVAEPDPGLGLTHERLSDFDGERRFSLRRTMPGPIHPLASALKTTTLHADQPILMSAVGAVASSHLVFAAFLASTWAEAEGSAIVFVPARQVIHGGSRDGSTLAVLQLFAIRASPKPPAEPIPAEPAEAEQ